MKASDYIVSFFEERGINVIFGYIGGMITHLVDSIAKNDSVRFIQTYHEQTAAIAAEGYALESGKPGVAIATSGPGATNLMTGIADAYFGSIPTIFITGQVNTYEYKYSSPVRQQGFQETDVVSMVRPVTKYAVLLDDAANLRYELEKAYYMATEGRPGPVLIDLPMDISRAEISPDDLRSFSPPEEKETEIDWQKVGSVIKEAKQPLLLIGGGCRGVKDILERYIGDVQIPYVTSLMGKGLVSEESPLYCGMIGSYGNRNANMIVSRCDCLIALGSRLDTRQTGARIEDFIPKAAILHVDIDDRELEHNRLKNRITVNSEVGRFVEALVKKGIHSNVKGDWLKWINYVNKEYNQEKEVERFVENKAPYRFFDLFNRVSSDGSIITVDIGQNQMWAAQSILLKNNQEFFTSGGLAPMGFSLPAAIGAAFASPQKQIYCFNGDGGFHMACQSLLLISQYGLKIKVIVLNNQALGMITQFQNLYFDNRMAGTTFDGGYCLPDIKAMAKCYHLPYFALQSDSITEDKLKSALDSKNSIVNYLMDGLTTVSPKLEYNRPIYDPTPHLPEEEMENVMGRLTSEN